MTSVAATSVRAAAVPVVRAVRVRSATVRGRLAVDMVAIVPTVRRVGPARRVIVLTVIVPRVTVRVRKASGSGRGAISATARRVIVPRVIVRVPSAIVRMARRVVTVLMVIARTAIVPASSVRKATAPRVIVPARTAAPVASAAGVVQPSRL